MLTLNANFFPWTRAISIPLSSLVFREVKQEKLAVLIIP
jgi:hypothetical protein